MQATQIIPVLRMFDVGKAREFYVEWLGFTVVWEHRFEPDMPLYMEIERGGMKLHLSEHHGDGTPGSRTFVWCTGLKSWHGELLEKQYRSNRPGIAETFYGALCVEVIDPFGNKILFNEKMETE